MKASKQDRRKRTEELAAIDRWLAESEEERTVECSLPGMDRISKSACDKRQLTSLRRPETSSCTKCPSRNEFLGRFTKPGVCGICGLETFSPSNRLCSEHRILVTKTRTYCGEGFQTISETIRKEVEKHRPEILLEELEEPEVVEKMKRTGRRAAPRKFSDSRKRVLVTLYDAMNDVVERREFMRRHQLDSSGISRWRKALGLTKVRQNGDTYMHGGHERTYFSKEFRIDFLSRYDNPTADREARRRLREGINVSHSMIADWRRRLKGPKKLRQFSDEYKKGVLKELSEATKYGEKQKIMNREGLASASIGLWKRKFGDEMKHGLQTVEQFRNHVASLKVVINRQNDMLLKQLPDNTVVAKQQKVINELLTLLNHEGKKP